MKQQRYRSIGLMSGTSLDGLDIAVVEFKKERNRWIYTLIKGENIPYSNQMVNELINAHKLSQVELEKLDNSYSAWLAMQTRHFITSNNLKEIDFISSHGHTIHHQPEKRLSVQIGNRPQIFKTTQIPVVCDFRLQDVLLGGQGAPLVPIGDALLFSEYDACLNLGGFANLSASKNGKRVAFDICPVNIVLNKFSQELKLDFDNGGNMARSGTVNPFKLKKLNKLDFYDEPPPKSLGREWVDEAIIPLFNDETSSTNKLATITEHAAQQIAMALNKLEIESILVTGGGAYNTYLIELIKKKTTATLTIPDKATIEFKEAIVFAFLGLLRLQKLPNCLASVTGAPINHSSGRVYC